MCEHRCVDEWLQQLKLTTENYDYGVPTIDLYEKQQQQKVALPKLVPKVILERRSVCYCEVSEENDDCAKMEEEEKFKKLRLSGSYENIWNCSTKFIDDCDLKHGQVCRISFEIDETVQDLSVAPIVLTKVDFTVPTSILQWKTDLMYDYSSEDDEIQEYASLEQISEERGQYYNQTRPFPLDNTVEIRHPQGAKRTTSLRSQTVHQYAFGNVEQQLENYIEVKFDIRGVTKIFYEGGTRKLTKGQHLRIRSDKLFVICDERENDVLISRLNETEYKTIGKKELMIMRMGDNRAYKFQFDSTKDMNLAIVDLESYYGNDCPTHKYVTNEEKSQIRYKLLKLLGKRSTKDLLEKKGIIRNEPIFGNTLKHLYEMSKFEVPEFVIRTIQIIEMPKNIYSVGLYRASGNLATIQKIRYHIDKNNLKILDEFKNDIDVLTGCLKLFFRELKEPLIPHKTYEELCKYIDTDMTAKNEESAKQLVNKMDKPHKRTLLTLLEHLLKVEGNSDENKMDAYNISIVWGPTLIWPPDNCHENILSSHRNANKVIELLLKIYKKCETTINKKESSQNVICKENNDNEAARDNVLNRNALMIELNENLTSNIKKGIPKDILIKSAENISKFKEDSPKTPNKEKAFELDHLSSSSKQNIPEFVLKVVPLIERGLNLEFLYKLSGSNEKLDKIKKKIMKPKSNLNSIDKYNVHDLAGGLKSFFLELKTPIIPKEVFEKLVFATEERIEITKLRNTKKEYLNSAIPYRETLNYLLRHLVKVSQHEESNKMSKHNIATEWAPILCHTLIQNRDFSTGICIQVVETLLQIYDHKTVININTERDFKQNLDVYNSNYQNLSRLDDSEKTENVAQILGPSPDKFEKHVAFNKRKGTATKNESSLYRVSKFFSNTLSMYDNVPYSENVKNEATILERQSINDRKTMEDRTKL